MNRPDDDLGDDDLGDDDLDQLTSALRQVVLEGCFDGDESAGDLVDMVAATVAAWLNGRGRPGPMISHYGHHYLRQLLARGDYEAVRLIAPQVIYQLLEEIDELKMVWTMQPRRRTSGGQQ